MAENDIDFHFRQPYPSIVLVCHCKSVNERAVRAAIEAGACTRRDVARRCGAGSVCGGCAPVIDELLEHHEASGFSAAPALELRAAS